MRLLACFFLILILIAAAPLAAQDTACLRQMGDAIQSALESCVALGDNQVCYGGGSVQAIPQPGAADLGLREPGDRASLYNLQSLAVGGDAYSVALMKLHPDLGGSFHNQTISLVLYGSARVEALSPSVPPTPVPQPTTTPTLVTFTTLTIVNKRYEADANSAKVGSLRAGESGVVLGRSTNGLWFYVAPELSSTGWVWGEAVRVEGDISALPVSNAGGNLAAYQPNNDPTPVPEPWQTFIPGAMRNLTVQSGGSPSPCSGATSGVLIQTSNNNQPLELMLNGVFFNIDGTFDVQAPMGKQMIIRVLAGTVEAQAAAGYVQAGAGMQFAIPMNAEGFATGTIHTPVPLQSDSLALLPLGLLPDYVAQPEPVSSSVLADDRELLPLAGLYQVSGMYTVNGCGDRYGNSRELASDQVYVWISDRILIMETLDRRGLLDLKNSMHRAGMFLGSAELRATAPDANGYAVTNPAQGVYISGGGYASGTQEIRLISSTRFEGKNISTVYAGCTQTWDYALDYVGPCVGLAEVSPGLQQCKNAP